MPSADCRTGACPRALMLVQTLIGYSYFLHGLSGRYVNAGLAAG